MMMRRISFLIICVVKRIRRMVECNIQKNRRASLIRIHMEYELYQINDYIVQYYNHIIYILIYLWSVRYQVS